MTIPAESTQPSALPQEQYVNPAEAGTSAFHETTEVPNTESRPGFFSRLFSRIGNFFRKGVRSFRRRSDKSDEVASHLAEAETPVDFVPPPFNPSAEIDPRAVQDVAVTSGSESAETLPLHMPSVALTPTQKMVARRDIILQEMSKKAQPKDFINPKAGKAQRELVPVLDQGVTRSVFKASRTEPSSPGTRFVKINLDGTSCGRPLDDGFDIRNVAAYRLAALLGHRDLVVESRSANFRDQAGKELSGISMHEAVGKNLYKLKKDIEKFVKEKKDVSVLIKPEFIRDYFNLHLFNYIIYSSDMNPGNIFVDIDIEEIAPNGIIVIFKSIQKIDNDLGFRAECLQDELPWYSGLYNLITRGSNKEELLYSLNAVDKDMLDSLRALDRETVEKIFSDLNFTKEELDALFTRIDFMRNHINEGIRAGKIKVLDTEGWSAQAASVLDFNLSKINPQKEGFNYLSKFLYIIRQSGVNKIEVMQ